VAQELEVWELVVQELVLEVWELVLEARELVGQELEEWEKYPVHNLSWSLALLGECTL